MTDADVVRQRIIASVFNRNRGAGSEDTYVSHVKIWEDTEDGTEKPRYIILAQQTNGGGLMHKAKLNTNGTFSVGKTWNLVDLQKVEAFSPQSFALTLARTYRWQTEDPRSQVDFLTAIVRLFRTVTRNQARLQIVGFTDPDEIPVNRQPIRPDPQPRHDRAQTPDSVGGRRRPVAMERAPTPSREPEVVPVPALGGRSQVRAPRPAPIAPQPHSPIGEASPPVMPAASHNSRMASPSNTRPSSPALSQSQSQSGSVRTRRPRAPSNATSTTRISTATTTSMAPSLSQSTTASAVPRPYAVSQGSRVQSFESSYVSSTVPSSTTTRPSMVSVDETSPTTTSIIAPTVSDYPPARPPANLTPPVMLRSRNPSSQSLNGTGGTQGRRPELNARVSFFDPANQAALDRLVTGESIEREGEEAAVEEAGTGEATLASVEEMLEGYEWASEDIMGKRARGPADQIEARLLDELMALEKANIYSFLESDERIAVVLQYLDKAVEELDNMDSLLSSYKIHLNAVNDDISYIQSQNRGLQVQTQNQKALLDELEQLLQTVHVDRDVLMILAQESLEKPNSIQRLEEASAELYKALLAGRDRDMAATMERLGEYQTHNTQFCKRLRDYLSIMFTAQSKMLLGDSNGLIKEGRRGKLSIVPHKDLEDYLGRYSGLMLYLKEMDEATYGKLCGDYFSAASDLHATQIKALMSAYGAMIKEAIEEEVDTGFSHSATPTSASFKAGAGIRRAGTMVRSGTIARKKDKEKQSSDANMRASDAFAHVIERISPQVYREADFIADFLQINDAALTFADYMGLENYYRRQATRAAGLSPTTAKIVRGGMDFIFGFLPNELKIWIEVALAKDNLQLIGIIAALERFLAEADERGNTFLSNLLEKQHTRLKTLFERHIAEQIKSVEQTKVTAKKRNGVAPFIRYFPTYISRVEAQLVGAGGLDVRGAVDGAYDRIVTAMFDALRHMAKMDGEGEDKGQLNYHVILIENMHHFVAEMAQVELGSVATFARRAEGLYDENLNAYVKLVLRRPFAKLIDYFDGVERLLTTTAPSEVASNSTYSKSALKKVLREFTGKDVRKHVDALSRRVEKHFTEASDKALATVDEQAPANSAGIAPGTVLVGVWRACEEELVRLTQVFKDRIDLCYKDAGVGLEYAVADIEAAFKKYRVGGQ